MGFSYQRVFVVVDPKGEIEGVYKNKDNALAALPEAVRHTPKELAKWGDWQYGRGAQAWKILEKKIRDSAGIPA